MRYVKILSGGGYKITLDCSQLSGLLPYVNLYYNEPNNLGEKIIDTRSEVVSCEGASKITKIVFTYTYSGYKRMNVKSDDGRINKRVGPHDSQDVTLELNLGLTKDITITVTQ